MDSNSKNASADSIFDEFKRVANLPVKGRGKTSKPEIAVQIYSAIITHGPVTTMKLVEHTNLPYPTLVNYLSKLKNCEWITSVRSKGDRSYITIWETTGKIGANINDRRPNPTKAPESEVAGRKMWPKIVTELQDYYRTKVSGLDESTVDDLMEGIRRDLDMVRELTNNRMQNALHVGRDQPNRKVLLAACKTLGLDPPRAGKGLSLSEARKKMKNLARAYHPDFNSGQETLFQNVLSAFSVIETFVTSGANS